MTPTKLDAPLGSMTQIINVCSKLDMAITGPMQPTPILPKNSYVLFMAEDFNDSMELTEKTR